MVRSVRFSLDQHRCFASDRSHYVAPEIFSYREKCILIKSVQNFNFRFWLFFVPFLFRSIMFMSFQAEKKMSEIWKVESELTLDLLKKFKTSDNLKISWTFLICLTLDKFQWKTKQNNIRFGTASHDISHSHTLYAWVRVKRFVVNVWIAHIVWHSTKSCVFFVAREHSPLMWKY